MLDFDPLHESFRRLTLALIEKGLTVSAMESCTGGLIASLITDTEGASAVLKGAFITYSNEAKLREGVPAETIRTFGVYSAETALAMARAAAKAYGADLGLGVTGSLGRVDPENADSVPGEVYIAVCAGEYVFAEKLILTESVSRFGDKLRIARSAAVLLEQGINAVT